MIFRIWLFVGTAKSQSITRVEGSTIRLTCRMKVREGRRVLWFKDRLRIDGRENRHFIFKNRGKRLIIKAIKQSDTGTYTCKDPTTREKVKSFRVVVTGEQSVYHSKQGASPIWCFDQGHLYQTFVCLFKNWSITDFWLPAIRLLYRPSGRIRHLATAWICDVWIPPGRYAGCQPSTRKSNNFTPLVSYARFSGAQAAFKHASISQGGWVQSLRF